MRRARFALPLLLSPCLAHAQNASTFGTLEGYGTLAAGGVVATITGDANRNATAQLEWRAQGAPAWRAGHPLVRVDATHFLGSLFWLEAGHAYDVRVTLADPDGVGATPARTASVVTRAEASPFVPTRTLYVSPGGSDAHDGSSPAQALKTIQRAANLARPGDLVSVAAGIYRESVGVPQSGSASQPIVFRGAPGAILDGADAAIAAGASWTNAGNGVWSRATGFATALVVSDQGRLFPYASLAALRTLSSGAPGGFQFDGTTLSVKFSDGSSPAQRHVDVARLPAGFVLDGVHHVRIENFEIRHYGSDEYGKGIYLRYASDTIVSGNTLRENAATGVWLKGGDRNLIEHNVVSDSSIFGWPWEATHDSSAQNNAIYFTNDVGRGNVIRRNTVHDTYDGLHPCGDSAPPAGFSNETDVYENTIYRHNDDAIEAEGYCANLRIWGNRIQDSLMAFAVAPAGAGPVWIVRNIAWNLGNTRSALVDGYTSSGIKINSDYPTPVGPLLLYHNSVVTTAPDTAALVLLDPGVTTSLRSRNNLYEGTHSALRKINTIALDLDYDDLHAAATPLVRWYSTSYADLAALRAGTGQELHGVSAPPLLGAPAAGDFMPIPASPLVDRGVPLPGINDAYADAAPDIGAVERIDLIFADGFD
ncbi:right-handed parallel beta-helix repeat-containing protein [Dokdonella fugitiva]|uniref:Parallel beta-helix repeat protein n=1 Tax=Dokdonella fugitiva TaxID=328517 RepID=A0A4R2ICR6_9GAMM|nr:right-handed parallel beta-helix repeat-containing protein [Dokdonella fugitiva]TCO41308.1 parallel beta-helix repeat protein [Dokdonella fugitiva]